MHWVDAAEETPEASEQLFTGLWQRALEQVKLLLSDGCEAIGSAPAVICLASEHTRAPKSTKNLALSSIFC